MACCVVARVNAALMRVVGVAISDERPRSSEAFTTVYDRRRKSIAAAASKKPELSRSSCRNSLQFCPLSAPVDLLILSAPARPPCRSVLHLAGQPTRRAKKSPNLLAEKCFVVFSLVCRPNYGKIVVKMLETDVVVIR